jgi:hypothetical protein
MSSTTTNAKEDEEIKLLNDATNKYFEYLQAEYKYQLFKLPSYKLRFENETKDSVLNVFDDWIIYRYPKEFFINEAKKLGVYDYLKAKIEQIHKPLDNNIENIKLFSNDDNDDELDCGESVNAKCLRKLRLILHPDKYTQAKKDVQELAESSWKKFQHLLEEHKLSGKHSKFFDKINKLILLNKDDDDKNNNEILLTKIAKLINNKHISSKNEKDENTITYYEKELTKIKSTFAYLWCNSKNFRKDWLPREELLKSFALKLQNENEKEKLKRYNEKRYNEELKRYNEQVLMSANDPFYL